MVPYCLKVAPDEQQVHVVAMALLEVGYTVISSVQRAVTATFYCDLAFIEHQDMLYVCAVRQATKPSSLY